MKTSYKILSRAFPFIVLILSCFAYSQEAFPLQSWKNKDGKTVEASLYSITSEEKVVIKLKNAIKHTISRNSLSEETLGQLDETISSIASQWNDEDVIPTASLAYKAAALGLPQRKLKKIKEFEYLKVVDFFLHTGGKGASVLLEKGIAVEFLPTGEARFSTSGTSLAVQASNAQASNASSANTYKSVLATKGAVYPMQLTGPLRWGKIGVNDCAMFTKLVRVERNSVYIDGEIAK